MRHLWLASLFIVLLAGCSDRTPNEHSLAASLRLGWIPSGSFSGEVTGRALFAEKHGLALEIRPGGPSLNTITLVASGRDTFGTLAADEVLLANQHGADLVIIGVINYVSPGGFVSLKENGINGPEDFPGHTVGILPFGSTTLLYEAMLARNDVDRSTIRELTVSPDLRPFLQGVYDVHPVFVYDETVTLDREGYSYSLIEPRNFGVDFKGPVYFTSRKTVEENPLLAQAFVRTMVDGWRYALANPDEAIRLLADFSSDIDPVREKAVLLKGADYFRAYNNQPINSDYESWNNMASMMVELGHLSSLPDLINVIKLEWVQEYYLELETTDFK